MNKRLISWTAAAACALVFPLTASAEATDTLAKVKASGVITMGVRESSGALSYTLGDGKYVGYHVEICQRIVANVEKSIGKKIEVKYQSVTSQNRIPLVQTAQLILNAVPQPIMRPAKKTWLLLSPLTWKKSASR